MTSPYKDKSPLQQGKVMSHLSGEFLNYRRIWLLSFILTALFALVPVIFFALIDYNLTQKSMEQDAEARASRLASNTWRSVSFFLDERRNAIDYVARSNTRAQLSSSKRLAAILSELRFSFGGFTDIGIINAAGYQEAYAGPYKLAGKDYKDQAWFDETMAQGTSVSDVFLGHRNVPHISIAIRHRSPNGAAFVVRATIEHQLPRIFSQLKTTHRGDIFLVNTQGTLQTPSRYFGRVLEPLGMALPPRTGETKILSQRNDQTGELIIAYRYIPKTPFVLMVVKSKQALFAPWHEAKTQLIKYLGLSISVILVWIWAVTAYMVRRLKNLDRKRAKYFHLAEYANKMASVGRLAAGVAHEINNPLAIINEKAGLIKDMAQFKAKYKEDTRLHDALDVILDSVKRCGRITRQLLSFGRQTQTIAVPMKLRTVLDEVLIFLTKEAELRKINISMDIPEDLPSVICDHGKLQQIMLNIINNAFSAMSAKGSLTITAQKQSGDMIAMSIADTGCGISEQNLQEIFEPFFSTKTNAGGTGLGLSITYGLVQELGGRIEVKSRVNQGTEFTVYLPTKQKQNKD
jgi:signal transduction histidine kinase